MSPLEEIRKIAEKLNLKVQENIESYTLKKYEIFPNPTLPGKNDDAEYLCSAASDDGATTTIMVVQDLNSSYKEFRVLIKNKLTIYDTQFKIILEYTFKKFEEES